MNPLFETYKLAMKKEGVLGALKTMGKFLGTLPFWIGGAAAAESVLGPKPKVKKVYVPRIQYEKMTGRRPQRVGHINVDQHIKPGMSKDEAVKSLSDALIAKVKEMHPERFR